MFGEVHRGKLWGLDIAVKTLKSEDVDITDRVKKKKNNHSKNRFFRFQAFLVVSLSLCVRTGILSIFFSVTPINTTPKKKDLVRSSHRGTNLADAPPPPHYALHWRKSAKAAIRHCH